MPRQEHRRRLLGQSVKSLKNPSKVYPAPYYGSPLVAYTLRKASPSSTLAIKVQRSSDNTLLDIGFLPNGDLDVDKLLNFVGSGNGTIQTWYDQSGNGRHLIQNTLASQPIIVTAGALRVFPGTRLPCPYFDGSRYMAVSGFTQVQPVTHFATVNASGSNPNSPAGTICGGTTGGHTLSYSGSARQFKFNTGSSITAITVTANDRPYTVSGTADLHDSFLEANGTRTQGLTGTTGIAGFEVGGAQGGQFKYFGYILEIYLYDNCSRNRITKIQAEMAKFAGTTYGILLNPGWTKIFLFVGDSLTFGQNSTGAATDYPSRYMTKITAGTYFVRNTGTPGHTTQQASLKANEENGVLKDQLPSSITGAKLPVSCFIMIGTNDIIHDEVSADTCYNVRLKPMLTGFVASGRFDNIYVLTIPPSGLASGSFASVVRAYNDLIRAGGAPGGDLLTLGVTAVVDIQQATVSGNFILDDTPANVMTVTGNAAYFAVSPDLTHLTDAAYDALASAVAAVVPS